MTRQKRALPPTTCRLSCGGRRHVSHGSGRGRTSELSGPHSIDRDVTKTAVFTAPAQDPVRQFPFLAVRSSNPLVLRRTEQMSCHRPSLFRRASVLLSAVGQMPLLLPTSVHEVPLPSFSTMQSTSRRARRCKFDRETSQFATRLQRTAPDSPVRDSAVNQWSGGL